MLGQEDTGSNGNKIQAAKKVPPVLFKPIQFEPGIKA
jgi:hypothetical protein